MSDEEVPAGPRGAKGDRGERGLSRLQGRAVVVLFLLAVLLAGGGLFWNAHQVKAEQSKWCGLVTTLDRADDAAPKKPVPGTFTSALVGEIHELRQGLGVRAVTDKVTLILDEGGPDKQFLKQGSCWIVLSARVPDSADQMIVGQAPATARFTPGGPPSLDLLPNDLIGPLNGDGYPGTRYTVYYSASTPGSIQPWSFYLLSANGATQRLSALAQVPAAQPGAMYLPLPVGSAPGEGQVPAVVLDDDGWHLDWQPNGTGADKTFSQDFAAATSVTVQHNLGKKPAVTVIDSAGDEVDCGVSYVDAGTVVLNFRAAFGGTVTCNLRE